MIDVIGVSFKEKGRIYYFNPNHLKIKKNITVIVETEKGLQFGKTETDIVKMDERMFKTALKLVVRIASREDYETNKKNIKDAKDALKKARSLSEEKGLKMQIIDAAYTFDRDQLIFRFISDNRVDFRELVKELAYQYKTRIELRQVGVRDKAKEIGGIGSCGRCFCCSKFLSDFDSVSINMAKNQNLSLNPSKINGACGRLLCCLKYEDECYSTCRKNLPEVGSRIKIKEGEGMVISLNVLEKSFVVNIPDVGRVTVKNEQG